MIRDVVPSEWEVITCEAAKGSDLVLVSPTGPRGHKKYRATELQWHPTDNDSVLTCTVRLRKHSKRHYEPHKCGASYLNSGAVVVDSSTGAPLLDEDGNPLTGRRLLVGAVKDRNRDDVIDYSGRGDEDGDGMTDYEECESGRDPCKKEKKKRR